MSAPYHTLILGGGVIGLTTAYYLSREGVRVTVIDKGDLGQEASWAGAGILSSGSPKRAHTPMGRFRALSVGMFPTLSAELKAETGIDNGYRRCGSLELLQTGAAYERRQIAQLVRAERGEGANCHILDSSELHQLEPALAAELAGAVHFPDMAQVRNPWHLRALIAACSKHGVVLKPNTAAEGIERIGDRVSGVRTSYGTEHADQIVIAAGSWTGMLLPWFGLEIPIHPVRGQIALVRCERPEFTHILQAGPRYLVPRDEGRILVGSTEEDVGFDKRNTVDAIRELLDFATALVPCLSSAQLERTWAGLRPNSPDGRPFIGPVPGLRNVFVAAGHYRSGIQLSPGTGLLMKELVLAQSPSLPLEPFRLDRPLALQSQKSGLPGHE